MFSLLTRPVDAGVPLVALLLLSSGCFGATQETQPGREPVARPAGGPPGGATEPTAPAGTRVPLMIQERSGLARSGEPVTSGVPIGRGELHDIRNVRLLRGGKEVPAQFRVTGLWRPSADIRWLLVDLQATIGAGERQRYTLEYGKGIRRAARARHALKIQQDAGGFSVDTGAATFRISKKRFSLFERVVLAGGAVIVDEPAPGAPDRGAFVRGMKPTVTRAIPAAGNQGRAHLIYVKSRGKPGSEDYTLRFGSDRAYEVTGKTAGAVGAGEFAKDFTSTDGALAIPRNAWLAHHYPKAGDVFTFRSIPPATTLASTGVSEIKVLESGALRTVLRVKGSFGPLTAPALEYTAWYHFHAGSSRVKLAFTVENNDHGGRTPTGNARNANIGGVNCVFFDEIVLRLPAAAATRREFALYGDTKPVRGTLDAAVELYQDSSGGSRWDRYRQRRYNPRPNSYVSFQGYRTYRGGEKTGEGKRAVGALAMWGARGGLAAAVRDFWQNFPKALVARPDGTVEIGLFPARYSGHFPLRSGEHKTHEVLLAFHGPRDAERERAAAAVRSFSSPVRLEASARHIASTGALGTLHPYDPERFKAYEVRNLSMVGIYPEGAKKGPSLFGQREKFDFYGWMDYGDVPMDFESGSGQWGMKYDLDYQMAQQYARTQRPEWWSAFAAATRHHADIDVHHQPHHPGIHYVRGGVWAHSRHNEPGHKNPHRNYNHFTKDLSFGARGGAMMYYLTGYWKARDSAIEMAENALARYMSPQKDPGDSPRNNRMGVRGDACTLNRLLQGYLLSGEDRFLERARWQIKSRAFNGKPAKHGGTSLWSSVFYMMSLARYVEMFPDDAKVRMYLLAHIETLRRSVHPETGIYYRITPQPDGSVKGSGTCSHYNIMAADALSIGFRLTGRAEYLASARHCFAYGVKNACWENGPATYVQIHSANGATHGNVFMATESNRH